MQLFILRHGDAPFNAVDGERQLSSAGAEETRQVVEKRLDQLCLVEHIICSPVLRARQTMDVVSNCLDNPHVRISFEESLKSESSINKLSRFLQQCPEQTTLLISHQPLVGQLVNFLQDDERLGVQMGTSCLAAFDVLAFSRGGASQQWLDMPQC